MPRPWKSSSVSLLNDYFSGNATSGYPPVMAAETRRCSVVSHPGRRWLLKWGLRTWDVRSSQDLEENTSFREPWVQGRDEVWPSCSEIDLSGVILAGKTCQLRSHAERLRVRLTASPALAREGQSRGCQLSWYYNFLAVSLSFQENLMNKYT